MCKGEDGCSFRLFDIVLIELLPNHCNAFLIIIHSPQTSIGLGSVRGVVRVGKSKSLLHVRHVSLIIGIGIFAIGGLRRWVVRHFPQVQLPGYCKPEIWPEEQEQDNLDKTG